MSNRIVLIYNLRRGVLEDDYERWVAEADAPFVIGHVSVLAYSVTRIGGIVASDDRPPFQYVETLEVTDVDAYLRDFAGPEDDRLTAEWSTFVQEGSVIAHGESVISYRRSGS